MTTNYLKAAPTELCDYHKDWKIKSPELKNEVFYILETLTTNVHMMSIWEKLASKKNVNNYAFDLFMLVQNTNGPYGADKLTKAKLRVAVQKIEKKSRELADLVDEVMPMHFIEGAAKRDMSALVTPIIRNRAPQAKQILNNPRVLSKPGSKFSKKTYFVRPLAAFFTETFGSPMHSTIADLYSIFMSEDKHDIISANAVASILRDSQL